jgi:hypothetical protein
VPSSDPAFHPRRRPASPAHNGGHLHKARG